ncbi:MAG: IS5/IS1182 family transposase, partial [Oscillospiraceae bacterium]|nr:IS5/IS1182 family transposase [Oscillospiraceae bacterium]MDR2526201.1 IS5/IS1182 family transposase [Oscillospiraceae bacterium]
FKIMANKYRNRRKCHNLRANLICGIINFEARI